MISVTTDIAALSMTAHGDLAGARNSAKANTHA
jgi:hypothetical protein